MAENLGIGVNHGKKVIVTKDGKKYEKAGLGNSAAAVMIANVAGSTVLLSAQKLGGLPIKSAMKSVANLDADVFKKAADAGFKASGLAEKGVKFVDATVENKAVVDDILKKSIPAWMDKFPPLKKIMEPKMRAMAGLVRDGKNAFYSPRAKALVVNRDKMGWAAFHEMGHALNNNNPGFGKVLAKARGPLAMLSIVSLLVALFKRKKAEGEEPGGVFDKTTTFIKNNCGKLAFLGMVPTLAEEGLASIKASKLAKNFISVEQLKTLNKVNGKAWLTYLATAVGMGLGAYTISKVRDAIAHPKEIKSNN